MLVLTRKLNERIMIGDDIVITFVELRSDNSVRIGIDAPRGVRIQREEILDAVADANRASADAAATAPEENLKKLLGGGSE
ncbi:carbon storage regulator [Glaciihabitans sp. dw_435]|uniref:carbon storage regulator n=1 Tax=Glaciihabitans sp. dw_435 TaxID=2720081 RepID=UPI001BD4651A|nr:carbon storage regulator [Glaciihabitans sp. dw_435]